MSTISLSHPLKVNGKDLRELECDLSKVTVDDFAEAEKRSGEKKGGAVTVVENDYTFHLYLGFMGITKAMPEVDIADLERVHGKDIAKIMGEGRFFFYAQEAEGSQERASEEQSESTHGTTDAAHTK